MILYIDHQASTPPKDRRHETSSDHESTARSMRRARCMRSRSGIDEWQPAMLLDTAWYRLGHWTGRTGGQAPSRSNPARKQNTREHERLEVIRRVELGPYCLTTTASCHSLCGPRSASWKGHRRIHSSLKRSRGQQSVRDRGGCKQASERQVQRL